jgi:polyisoprenoid-binding protein YceI
MKNKIMTVMLLSAAFTGFSVMAETAKEVKSKANAGVEFVQDAGKVDFFAIGKPSMLKVHGENTALKGSLKKDGDKISGKFLIPMKGFVTGMKLRDDHLRDKVFSVSQYPTAELTVESFAAKTNESVPFTGKLKFHGVEKEIKGEVKASAGEKEILIQAAKFDMKMTDFNISPPEFAGMKMEDDVRIEVSGQAKASM